MGTGPNRTTSIISPQRRTSHGHRTVPTSLKTTSRDILPSDYPTSTWQWLRSTPDTLGRWPQWRWLFLDLMDTTSLLLEESRDTLNSSTASQTTNCRLGDSLDVIKQDLPVTLDTSFAGPLGFRKGWAPKRTDVARPLAKETNNNDQWFSDESSFF